MIPPPEKLTRNLLALSEVSRQATANLDRTQMLEVVVQAIQDVMGYHMASILLLDETREVLISSAISSNLQGKIPLGDRVPIGRGMVGRAVRTGQTQLANNVKDNADYIRAPGDWDPGSELSVPIKAGGQVIGVLDAQDEAANSFSQEDVQTLETLAEQLVVILQKARLFSDARATLRDLTILYEVSQKLSVARTTSEALRLALEALTAHTPYRCTIALLEFDPLTGKAVRFFVPYYFQPGEGIVEANLHIPTTEDDLNELLDAGQTVAIPDVAEDPRVPEVLRKEQATEGRPALALIPLIVGRKRIGNLILSYTEPHPWSEAELRLFSLAANQIAPAVENTRRYQREVERTERLGLIARVGQQITARLNPDELLAETTEALFTRLNYDHVSIFLLDADDPGMLVQRSQASRWPHGESPGYRQSVTQGILGEAAQKQAVVLVNDVTASERYIAVPNAEIRAELTVPIQLGTRLLGVLDIAGMRPFSEEDVTSVTIIADQLAIALENASLYGRAQSLAALEERQRLARDLHDSVTQLIFSTMLIAQSVSSIYKRNPEEGERRITRMLELSQQALGEMRTLLAELRLTSPVENGLLPALEQHLKRIRDREKLQVDFSSEGYQPQAPEIEEALFRMTQEALNNVVKHARARHVEITLKQEDGRVFLAIADNGQGFNPEALLTTRLAAGKFGVVGIQERARKLGGKLEVASHPETGTRLCISIPVKPAAPMVKQ